MPTFKDSKGNTKFSMNPQVGKGLYGDGAAPGIPGMAKDPAADPMADPMDDGATLSIHKGSSPDGMPPPGPQTKFYTVLDKGDGSPPEIINHDDYSGVSDVAQQWAEGGDMGMEQDPSAPTDSNMGDDGGDDGGE